MILRVSIDFFARLVYNIDMSKVIVSIFVLAVTIIATIILYTAAVARYPDFGSFYNLLFIGLIIFGAGVGIFLSGLLLEQGIRENNNNQR